MSVDFKKLMIGRFMFAFAISMQAIIIGWTLYDLTRDPLKLGLVGLTEAVPALSLALWAGYVVDRSRPLVIYRRVLLGSLLSALVLFGSQLTVLHLPLHQRVIALFASSFLTGTARAFSQPSLYATVPRLVAREGLSKASALMATVMQIARVSGPGLGGLIFGYFGGAVASGMTCAILAAGLGCLALIRTPIPPPAAREAGGSILDELLSGVNYVFGHPILLSALSLDMISVLFGGVTALLPIFSAEILHSGAKGLGLLRASPAVGAALTSFVLTRIDIRRKAGYWLFAAVTGFGASILVFGVSRSFPLSILALALSGGFDSVSMVIRTVAVQLASPDSMRGKISAVNSIFIGSSNELGEFESGVAAKLMGTVPSVIFGGVVCLGTVATVAWLAPALRRMGLDRLKVDHA